MKRLLRFFFPWVCVVCRKPLTSAEDEGFCGVCWLRLPRIQGMVCRCCGIPLQEGGRRCFSCRKNRIRFPIRAAGLYESGLRQAVLRLKYGGRRTLAPVLSILLEQCWRNFEELQQADLLVPVPLHRRRLVERGFNQAEELAKALGERVGRSVLRGLVRHEATKPQANLSRMNRFLNVQDAFRITEPTWVKNKHILLIDDVCTTASTLRECAGILYKSRAKRVSALVLARDEAPFSN